MIILIAIGAVILIVILSKAKELRTKGEIEDTIDNIRKHGRKE